MTGNAIRAMLDRISGCYLVKMPEGAVAAWSQALDGIDDATGQEALTRYIRDSEKTPKPADIIKRAQEIRSTGLTTESVKDRLARLNRAAVLRGGDRLRAADEEELRFQRWKLKGFVIGNDLTEDLKLYFNRVLGSDVVKEVIEDVRRHRKHAG